ncbi:ATP-binding protein [Nonomuraea sp. MG754425]|uniref:ATP-binding protein n=1 Tax=Nonomuraea sp. MG754425 TaxID=2570319 RepID=UPI001F360F8D|nr:ATP-binding protein [Nonomuraea sp. MG754425]
MASPDSNHANGDDQPGAGDVVARLPGTPSQVARARQLVTAALGRDHPLYDEAVLLTSELATNAVLHTESGSGGSFTVTVNSTATAVRVFVADGGSEQPPCVCRANARATSGRGLPLIEALSDRWGFTREEGATTVWFEMSHDRLPAQVAV